MNIRNRKGYILPMAIIFTIVCAVMSLGFYAMVENICKFAIKETERAKGYYADMAGLRYASILLRDPAAPPLNFDPEHDGESKTISVKNDYNSLYVDLGLRDPRDVTITITEGNDGLNDGLYDVTAAYNY